MTASPQSSVAPSDAASTGTAVPFDAHGIEPIPDGSRDCSPWELFWIWAGANIAPINWVLGALGITLGLSLVETLIVVAVGNIIGCAVFGLFNVIGHRTAVNQMVLGRAPFGSAGAAVPGVVQFLLTMGWVGVNTWVVLDLVMAILAEVGLTGGVWLDVAVAAVIMAIQLGLALYGFYAIRSFEKYTVPATAAVMGVMTVLAIATTDVDWTLQGTAATTADEVTAITQLLTAIGIGWGLTWIPYASDYSRFVRVGTPSRTVFWSSALGMYIPTVWLAVLGACLASAGSGSDPSTLVVSTFGVMAIPVLLLLVHGPIATNVLNLYSCALAALSIGMRAARWKVTLVAGVCASAVLAVFVEADSFAHAFDNWMVSILVWISPWATIVAVDYLVLRGGALDVGSLYSSPGSKSLPRYRAAGLISLGAGVVAGWAWQYGLVSAMQGPLATAFGDTDFSWLSGSVVAGGLYLTLSRRA
ncbi:cytosine permease [Mycobacterium manitobense]|uniref:Cytosine permease n=1 Tax=[Mycobacterium] manitobense TaxID=190147 RepID=A0A9X2Y7A2_9MYCO|nr:cytosine permease [[Mycobacterium] manitobense]MCV7169238.1 cytosine permease [[Mycobacterium] manitobense]